MKEKLIVLVLLSASVLVAQYDSHGYSYETSGSVESKGGHSINGKSMIDDVSDIYYFPSEVAQTPDVAQGTAIFDQTNTTPNYVQGSAFVVKTLTKKISAGFVFGKTSVIAASGMAAVLDSGNAGGPGLISQINTALNGHDFSGVIPPSNSVHFLLGYNLSDNMKVALDLFREASNYQFNNKLVQPTYTNTTDRFIEYGAVGLNGGIESNIGSISLKAVAGISTLGFDAENKNTNGLASVDENNTISTESGLYIPVSGKAQLKFSNHTITTGIDFQYATYGFKAVYENVNRAVDPILIVSNEMTTSTFSLMGITAGVLDEMKVGENTRVYASLVLGRTSVTQTPPDSVTNANREIVTTNILFPKTSVGVEHVINKMWKFDQLILRAGGFKTYTWQTVSTQGSGDSNSDESDFPASSPFQWTTGLGFVMGKVSLDLTIRPDRWSGIHFISGQGPYAGTVTMTYNY